MAVAALSAHDLYRFYHAGDDETFALRGVSLRVQPGEVVAISGPSGSGKSTLLACLAGLDELDGGYVEIAGARITRRPEAVRSALRAKSLGVLLQSDNLVGHLTVAGNVRAAQALVRGPHPDINELLGSLGIADRGAAWPATLSGGEAARAGLAVALANSPAVLLADEPTGEVDSATQEVVLELLRERAKGGTAVLVVTHSARVAATADRRFTLTDGRLEDV